MIYVAMNPTSAAEIGSSGSKTSGSSLEDPADRNAVISTAHGAGWHCQWLWRGSHRAEAVALLTPA